MIATQRRLRLAVIPVAFAALALAGCQDKAPAASPPTDAGTGVAAQPTAINTPVAPTAVETTASPTSEFTPTETPSSTTTPPVTGGSGGGCVSSGTYDGKAGAAPKANGSVQTYQDTRATVSITIGKPTIDPNASDTFFPGAGRVTAVYPVTIKGTGGLYVVSPQQISLIDGSKMPCSRDTLARVVPSTQQLPIKILQDGETITAKAAFAVPAGTDLSQYQVLYTKQTGSMADLAWNGS